MVSYLTQQEYFDQETYLKMILIPAIGIALVRKVLFILVGATDYSRAQMPLTYLVEVFA